MSRELGGGESVYALSTAHFPGGRRRDTAAPRPASAQRKACGSCACPAAAFTARRDHSRGVSSSSACDTAWPAATATKESEVCSSVCRIVHPDDDADGGAVVREGLALDRGALAADPLGLQLGEAKDLLVAV